MGKITVSHQKKVKSRKHKHTVKYRKNNLRKIAEREFSKVHQCALYNCAWLDLSVSMLIPIWLLNQEKMTLKMG